MTLRKESFWRVAGSQTKGMCGGDCWVERQFMEAAVIVVAQNATEVHM
jgi:hypothetical protein